MRAPQAIAVRLSLLSFALILGPAPWVGAGVMYSITPLDATGQGHLLWGGTINNQGQVVGTLQGYGSRQYSSGVDEPFLYDGRTGNVTLPGVIPAQGADSGAFRYEGNFNSINDLGQAVGNRSPAPVSSVGRSTVTTAGGFVYDPATGRTTDLPGYAVGINNAGDVVGSTAYTNIGQYGSQQPWLDSHGTVRNLGVPSGTDGAKAVAINDAGQVVVNTVKAVTTPATPYGNVYPAEAHSFVFDKNKWTDLGTLGGSWS